MNNHLSFAVVSAAIAVTSFYFFLPELISHPQGQLEDHYQGLEVLIRFSAYILNMIAGVLIASKLFLSSEKEGEEET